MRGKAAERAPKSINKSNNRDNSTRAEILDAAARLVVEQGYGACTMRSISESVKIKAGSLYYHFSSKEEIVVEIMNMGVEMLLKEVESKVEQLPDDVSWYEKFRVAVQAHVNAKVDPEIPFMQVYEHLPPIIKRESRSMRQKYAKFWYGLIKGGQDAGEYRSDLDIDTFLPFFLGGLNRVPEWFHADRMDPVKIADSIVDTLLSGLKTR